MTVSVDVVIPKLGMTMQEGTLVEWLVADGATVVIGEPIFVLNTDKLDAEIEAEAAGTLHHVASPGQTLPAGGVIGTITPTPSRLGGDGRTEVEVPAAAATNGRRTASPNARRLSRDLKIDLTDVVGSGAGGRILGRDVEQAAAGARVSIPPGEQTRKASFAARRMAATLGIDLGEVEASAPQREISRQDVERAAARALSSQGPSDGALQKRQNRIPEEASGVELVPLTAMRRVIASRMHSSLHEMAQLTIGMEMRAGRLVSLRESLKSAWSREGRAVPTFADLVAYAASQVLPEHRELNAVMTDDAIELWRPVHVGMAVALDDGLVVPVVRDVDQLSLSSFAECAAALVQRARSGQLSIEDISGATFSVSSLGGLGVDFFTPVINPPNVAILGVGRIRDGVRLTKKRRLKPNPTLTLSLTFDHRAVDGAPAAEFLRAVRDLVEEPNRLLR